MLNKRKIETGILTAFFIYRLTANKHLSRFVIMVSGAEPPLFWPAPEIRGSGADSGCGHIGSASVPAP